MASAAGFGRIDVACSTNSLEHRLEVMEAMVQSLRATTAQPATKVRLTEQSRSLRFSDLPSSDVDSSSLPEMGSHEGSTYSEEAFYGNRPCKPFPLALETDVTGPSSTIAFLRQVLKSIDSYSLASHDTTYFQTHLESIRPESSPPSSLFCSKSEALAKPSSEDDLYDLPTYSSTILLVTIFFRGYGSMNPFLNDITFLRTYVKEVYENSGLRLKASRLALLNMILAVASATSVDSTYPVEHWIRLSKTCYRRARGLYVQNIFQPVDLELGE